MNLDRIIDAISVTAESLGQSLSPSAIALLAQDLEAERASDEAVLNALYLVRRECRRLTLADILERLWAHDGRPVADEAWMTALVAQDESATVIWTEETRQAFEIARPALEINDKIGARMAFRAAYDRIVAESRESGRPVQWEASLGFDPECRRIALEAAVQTGKLQPNHAQGLLPPPPADERVANAVLRIASINGDLVAPEICEREIARRRIAELRAILERKSA